MSEINGFQVEKFNQYNLIEKSKSSICPLCSASRKKKLDKCATLHWDSGLGVCSHCGERFQLHTYKKKTDIKPYVKPEWKNNTELSDKVTKWFEGRGITQFTLRMMKITEGKEWMPQTKKPENTIQFNYFRNNELINIKYRDGAKNFKLVKDAERIFYNLDACHVSKDIIIVEGEIDCLSFVEVGLHNVVSVPNGSTIGTSNLEYLDNCIQYFENKEKVYLALDTDEAGISTRNEMIRRLGSKMCFLVDFKDCKDANEYLIKYGRESLILVITEAKEIPIEGVSSVFDFQPELEEYLINGMKSGFKIGIKSFDSVFSTYTGQYIAVTGIPSSGKSDFVDMMCLGYNRNYGWKIAYASPENKPNTIHAGKLISKITGMWVNKKDYLVTDWFKKAVEYMDKNIKFIDLTESYDLDSVLAKTKQLIFKYGIKVLVIDPYNKVRLKSSLNKNINEYTNDYLLMIDEFARRNDILIILVAHPRKPSGLEVKGYEPSFYDIKGGGEFYDMSPHGLLVHRDYENEMVKVKVLKIKFNHLGENNKHVWLKWNEENGRYIDFSNQNDDVKLTSLPMYDNNNWLKVNCTQSDLKFNKVSITNIEEPIKDSSGEIMPF